MKRFFKRVLCVLCCVASALAAVRFGPTLCVRLFGDSNTQWISERFTQTLHEKNELIVYEVSLTGQETVTQDAWLIGTVQKVVLPYTFDVRFTVDLSQAQVAVSDSTIIVSIPEPRAGYQKLTVDETKIQKVDWLYPLSPERYTEITKQVEQKLFEEAASNQEFLKNAWKLTTENLRGLFSAVADQSVLGMTCEIRIVPLQ